jgi:hypothetical protein
MPHIKLRPDYSGVWDLEFMQDSPPDPTQNTRKNTQGIFKVQNSNTRLTIKQLQARNRRDLIASIAWK